MKISIIWIYNIGFIFVIFKWWKASIYGGCKYSINHKSCFFIHYFFLYIIFLQTVLWMLRSLKTCSKIRIFTVTDDDLVNLCQEVDTDV